METKTGTPFLTKVFVCSLAILVGAYPLIKINPSLLPTYLSKSLFVYIAIAITLILLAILILWQIYERNSKIDSRKMCNLFHSIIAYFLALGFTKWALLKFCHLHMTTSLAWMEMPSTMLSGYQKVSHFYGQNYPMVVTLGTIELAGAIFVLFRKTRLLGAFILSIASINILLIDILYKIPSPISEAAILLIASGYYIFLERKNVIKLFFKRNDKQSKFRFITKSSKLILKLSALVIPFLIFIPNYQKQYRPSITGKYMIMEIRTINNSSEVVEIDSSFEYVYFDLGDYFAFTSADFGKRQVGHLKIDEKTRKFVVEWIFPKNLTTNFVGEISAIDSNDNMHLLGSMGGNKFEIELHKEKVKSIWKTY